MRNNGLFGTLYIEDVRKKVKLDDAAQGRMTTLAQTWFTRDAKSVEALWDTFMKQALGYLQFAPANAPAAQSVYPV